MRRRIKLVLAVAMTLSLSERAFSDGVYVTPTSGPYNWSGIYLGVTAGYASGEHSSDDLAGAFLGYPDLPSGQSHGFAGGGTLGVNWQAGGLVYGLETDIAWLTNETSFVDPNGAINAYYPSATNRLNYLGTVRGRLGLAIDNSLLYVTAGLAYGGVENTARYNSTSFPTIDTPQYDVKSTRLGYVVGAGIEHAIARSWTLKGEALYADLQPNDTTWVSPGSGTFPAGALYDQRFNTSVTIIRAGLNYKFDWHQP